MNVLWFFIGMAAGCVVTIGVIMGMLAAVGALEEREKRRERLAYPDVPPGWIEDYGKNRSHRGEN